MGKKAKKTKDRSHLSLVGQPTSFPAGPGEQISSDAIFRRRALTEIGAADTSTLVALAAAVTRMLR